MNDNLLFRNWNNRGHALITGASAGIGLSFAIQLAELKFTPILIARRKDKLDEIANELNKKYQVKCVVIAADLANPSDRAKVVEYIKSLSDLDILVNNAGFGTLGYFHEIPLDKTQNMMQVHLDATVEFTYAAIPQMLQRKRGAIINVASLNAYLYLPGNAMYDATKSFLKAFTETIGLELGYQGLKTQVLCPGFTQTEFHEVGDFKNFKRSTIPKALWMSSEQVVEISLKELNTNHVVVIPGWKNKLVKFLFLHTPVGSMFQKNLRDAHDKKYARMNQSKETNN